MTSNFWRQLPSLWQNFGLEITLVVGISLILSVFFYLLLGRIRRHILVDLGHHKWIIK